MHPHGHVLTGDVHLGHLHLQKTDRTTVCSELMGTNGETASDLTLYVIP